MTDNEKIDKLLAIYCKEFSLPKGVAYSIAFGEGDNLSHHELTARNLEILTITDSMLSKSLLTQRMGVECSATTFGREIQAKGGWIKFCREKEEKEKKIHLKEELEFKTMKQQLRNNSIKFLLIGGLIGLIAGIILNKLADRILPF